MRHSPDLLARIRDTLADLLTERGDILRVLADAGIAAHRVRLEQDAVAVWQDALDLAADLGLVRGLLTVALRDYATGPARDALLALLRSVDDAEQAARRDVPPRLENSEKNGTGAWNNCRRK